LVCIECSGIHRNLGSHISRVGINLEVLVCIENSGIHRNLGSHISRVSLNLGVLVCIECSLVSPQSIKWFGEIKYLKRKHQIERKFEYLFFVIFNEVRNLIFRKLLISTIFFAPLIFQRFGYLIFQNSFSEQGCILRILWMRSNTTYTAIDTLNPHMTSLLILKKNKFCGSQNINELRN